MAIQVTRSHTAQRTPQTGIVGKSTQFLALTTEAKALNDRAATLKKDLMAFLDENGEADERGHKTYTFPEPLTIGGKTFTGLKRERRVSDSFDEDVAETILTAKNLLAQALVQPEPVIDQDAIYVLQQEGKITAAELDSMFVQTESWAFKPLAS